MDIERRNLALSALQWFCHTSIDNILSIYNGDDSTGDVNPLHMRERLLKLVHSTIDTVPAYKV
jgi:hypothetical protein